MRGNPIESEIFPDVIHKKTVLLDKNFFEKLINAANIHSIIEYRSKEIQEPKVFNITLLDKKELNLTLLFTINSEKENSYLFRISQENYIVKLYKGKDKYNFFIKKEIITTPFRMIRLSIIVLPKEIYFVEELTQSNPTEIKNCVIQNIKEIRVKIFSINTRIIESGFGSSLNTLNSSSSYIKNIEKKHIDFNINITKPLRNSFFIIRMRFNPVYSNISDRNKNNLIIETDTGFYLAKKPKAYYGSNYFIFNKAKNQIYHELLPARTNINSNVFTIVIDKNLNTPFLFYDYRSNFLMLYSTSPFLNYNLGHNIRYNNKNDEINPYSVLDFSVNHITNRSQTIRRNSIPSPIRNNMNSYGNKIVSMFLEPRFYHTPDNTSIGNSHSSHTYTKPMNSIHMNFSSSEYSEVSDNEFEPYTSNLNFFNSFIRVSIPLEFINTVSNMNNDLEFVYTINNVQGNLDYYSDFIL